jgi:hypothetical protein
MVLHDPEMFEPDDHGWYLLVVDLSRHPVGAIRSGRPTS